MEEQVRYESDEVYVVVMANMDEILEIYAVFEQREEAMKFATDFGDFGNKNINIRVMPTPFFRSKK
jgi:hypothetical protein